MTSLDDSTPDARTELADCRNAIEVVDHRIVSLLADRVELARRTAGIKRAAGMPILDPQREAEAIWRAVATAREHALATEPVREIFWHIVGMSRRAQEEAR